MKKGIYIPILILVCVLTTLFYFKYSNTQLEKVTIQTGFRPIQGFTTTGVIVSYGASSITWVKDKNKKANSISFYADEATLALVVAKLKLSVKNYSNKNGQQKLAWVYEKNEESIFLRLINPSKDNYKVRKNGC